MFSAPMDWWIFSSVVVNDNDEYQINIIITCSKFYLNFLVIFYDEYEVHLRLNRGAKNQILI